MYFCILCFKNKIRKRNHPFTHFCTCHRVILLSTMVFATKINFPFHMYSNMFIQFVT